VLRWKPFSDGAGSSGMVAADRSAREIPAVIGAGRSDVGSGWGGCGWVGCGFESGAEAD